MNDFTEMLKWIDANLDTYVKQQNRSALHLFLQRLGFDLYQDREILINQMLYSDRYPASRTMH